MVPKLLFLLALLPYFTKSDGHNGDEIENTELSHLFDISELNKDHKLLLLQQNSDNINDNLCIAKIFYHYIPKCETDLLNDIDKKRVAIELTMCLFNGNSLMPKLPSECFDLKSIININKCIAKFANGQNGGVMWTTYFGYLNILDNLCSHYKNPIENLKMINDYQNMVSALSNLVVSYQNKYAEHLDFLFKNITRKIQNEFDEIIEIRINKVINQFESLSGSLLYKFDVINEVFENRMNDYINTHTELKEEMKIIQHNMVQQSVKFDLVAPLIAEVLIECQDFLDQRRIMEEVHLNQAEKLQEYQDNQSKALDVIFKQISDVEGKMVSFKNTNNVVSKIKHFVICTLLASTIFFLIVARVLLEGLLNIKDYLRLLFFIIGLYFGWKTFECLF